MVSDMRQRRLFLLSAMLLTLMIVAGSMSSSIDRSAEGAYPPPATRNPSDSLSPYIYLPLVRSAIPPPAAPSYYLQNLNILYDLGYSLGQHDHNTPGIQDNLVILDYGYPSQKDGVYGVKLTYETPGSFHSVLEVISSSTEFARGYWVGTGDDFASHLTIVVGVNNCCIENTLAFFRSHGTEWGNSVNSVVLQISVYNQSHDQLDAVSGMDIEMDWNHPYRIAQWLDYYKAASTCDPGENNTVEGCFYNFGIMPISASGTICATNDQQSTWNACDVWYVSWGAQKNNKYFARPLPEIYHSSETLPPWGTDATGWKNLSLFSADQMSAGKMYFVGSLTQRGRCGDGCASGDNYPSEGYWLLYDALASNPITRMSLRWSTDISNQQP
jgi:hypothetical protein